jgi:pyrroloquinoline quinone biosynthesis protein B
MKLLSDLDESEKNKIYFTHFNHTNRILDQDKIKEELVRKNSFNILNEGEILE